MIKKFLLLLTVLSTNLISAQTISVTSPNGGENWASCSTYNITWTHSGTSGFFNIEYSTNNGTTWASLATNYSSPSFAWTVPNISTTQALVRVYDYSNNTVTDQSNANFTITAAVTVTAANGGETWQGGSAHLITWTQGTGVSNYWTIRYSLDAGSSWNSIITNSYITTGQYNWNVPNTPSAQCLIQIYDHQSSSCKTDNSNTLFTISPATPIFTVTTPNGGNTFYVGGNYTINWTYQYVTGSFVMLEYSTDNGSTWNTIISSSSIGSSGSGSYSWTNVPNTPSNQCLVRVSESGNSTVNDVSNAVFNIKYPYIVVTSPNGSESWNGCTSQTISWTPYQYGSMPVKVEYTTDNGTTWNILTSSTTATTFNWSSIPNTATSTQCKVRVTKTADALVTDASDANFTINKVNYIVVTSPNGGETWQVNNPATRTITWTYGSGTSNYFNLYYSIDGGSSWTTISSQVYAGNTGNGSYTWTVPNVASTNCLIKITDYNNTCRTDQSDAVFSIVAPSPVIIVTSPNGGNTFYVGGNYTINWTYQYVSGTFVLIEYSVDNGSTWNTIVSSSSIGNSGSGSYSWTNVPNTPSNQCLVRVSEFGNTIVNDVSNAVFDIKYPYVVVNAPNGSESWNGCTSQTISWSTYQYGAMPVKVEYSTDNGTSWNLIIGSTTSSSITWSPLPNIVTSTQCKVRVTKTTDALVTDVSNANFTLNKVNYIVITSPNGGESWQVNNPATRTITWTYGSGTSNYFNLYYSIDGGSNWTTIGTQIYAGNTGNGSYTWTVPNVASTNCIIRINDYNNTCRTDQSDAAFSILAPSPVITVTTPNGGNTLYVGGNYSINWTYQYVSGTFVMIEYSTDNGTNWTTISSSSSIGTSGNGSFTWNNVPNTPSNQCLVRVSEFANSIVNDVSNAVFDIKYPYVEVLSPNGSETWNGCTSQTISWAAYQYGSMPVKVEYTTDNGTTWNILTSSTTASSYNWNPVPNTATSTQCKVRVTKTSDALVTDVSNANFTINKVNYIVVTSPNGGESWQINNPSTRTITWTYGSGTSNYFNLYYSIDGGSSWTSIYTQFYAGNTGNGSYTWTVPNAASTNCLIKINDYNNVCRTDQSDAVFSIVAPTPLITVTSPNGGNTFYVGGNYTIYWTYQYVSGSFVVIEYSIDNGTTWTSIVSSASIGTSGNGSYTWSNVPNTPSNQCLVRVSEFGNTIVNDASNAVFDIKYPYVVVNAPNGSESWNGCTSQTISWSAYQYGAMPVKVEYTTDNGTTWNLIIGSTTSSSITWSPLPNTVTSTQCKVRVTKTTDPLVTDVSNANFTLNKVNYIVITSPNGGETWQVNNPATRAITWTYGSGTSNYFNLYYSIDGGSNWTTIGTQIYAGNTGNGSYTWTVPNVASSNCIIRINDYNNTCRTDQSDAVFSITAPTPVITVTTPNGGNTYYVGGNYTINWNYQYVTGTFVMLEYSTDNGSTWNTIVSSSNIGTSGSGSYSWNNVPNTPSIQCLVRVSEFGNPTVNDISDAVFDIEYPHVEVLAPNGSETWNGCTSQTISWAKYQYGTMPVNVEYTTDNGSTWNTLASGTTSSSYTWNPVPNSATNTQCKVRVTKTSDPLVTDASDANFTINKVMYIIVNTPNGGEQWQVNNPVTQNITWAYGSGTSNYFNLYYSINGGSSWISITTQYYAGNTGNGSYTWTVPNAASTNCLIRIDDYNNTCRTDQSNAAFSIVAPTPYIVISNPNGGNVLYSYNNFNITWSSAYLSSSFVRIDYSADNGGSWTNITSSTSNSGTYSWTIPNISTTQALVRVMDFGNSATYDVSNAVFTIKPAVVVMTPNGAENLNGCTVTSITWQGESGTNSYSLQYSSNGGSTWNTIVSQSFSGGPNYSYNWTLPNISSDFCLVKITHNSNSSKTDQSDAVFKIIPAITVTNPNNGGSYAAGSVMNITWASVGVSNFYNIDYSINGGSTWTNIVFNSNITTNSYNWTIPSTPSTTCLIKVTDFNATCKTDQTDFQFTIATSPAAITVASPNGGENRTVCTPYNITWSANGTSGNYNIDYSSDNGATWTSVIANFASTNGVYAWTSPSTTTLQGLIRVTDAGNGALTDQSNAVFAVSNLATPATISGNAAVCEGSSQTYSVPLVAGATSYVWTLPSGWLGSSTSNLINVIPGTSSGSITVTANNSCNTSTASTKSVTATPLPATPGTISGNITTCAGSTQTYSISAVSGATSYTWLLPSGWIGNSTTTSITATAGSVAGSVQVYANNSCGSGAAASLSVTPSGSLPAQPGNISGLTSPCSGTLQTYSVAPVSGATSYNWTLPGTWTGTSTTNTINATVGTSGGLISVSAGNICGTSPGQTLSVTTTDVPAQPGSISGNATICQSSVNTYSISPVTGATSYTWTMPSGWTGTSSTTAITTTVSAVSGNVQVTANNGCGASVATTFAVTVNPTPAVPTITAGGPTTFCQGANVVLTSSSSNGYSWSPNSATNQAVTITATGNYVVTVTDVNSCSATSAPTSVTVNPNPSVTATASPSAVCVGISSTLTASGATSYLWNTGATTASITVSPSTTTTYTITGTTNGCSAISTPTLTVNQLPSTPVITLSGPATFCVGGSVTLTSSSENSYSWSTGATTQSIVASVTGNYSVTVSSINGCSSISAVSPVLVNPLPIATITADGPTTFCAGDSVILTSSSSTGNLWSTTATTQSIKVTSSATYSLTVTDGNSCSAGASISVTVNTPPNVTVTAGAPAICEGSSTTLSANGASSYAWSPPTGLSSTTGATVTASPNAPITYTVIGTDGNNCTNSNVVTLNVNPAPAIPTITASGPLTFCTGGNVVLTSTTANTYSWSPGSATTQTITATTSGTYAVTISDANGCTSVSLPSTVVVNTIPTVTATASLSTICSGTSSNLTASGATSYTWLPATGLNNAGIFNPVSTPSATTTYTVTGTTNGCSNTATKTITVNQSPAPPVVTPNGPTTFCTGGSVVLASGTENNYSWSSGPTTQSITVTVNGNYVVTTTDINNCSASSSPVSVTVNSNPAVTVTTANETCAGNDGTASATVVGGTSPYTYQWSNMATAASLTGLSAGTFSVTVTDSLGCTGTNSGSLIATVPPVVTASASSSIICAGSSSTLTASGATTYVWSPSTGLSSTTGASVTASPTATIPYTVTGTTNGCSSTTTITITVNALPSTPTVTQTGMDLVSSSSTGNQWYLNGNLITGATNQTYTPTQNGNYTVVVTDVNVCSATSTVYIYTSFVPAPVANFVANTTAITVGSSVNFTDLSTNNPTGWLWTFTGGTPATSSAQNPTNIVYNSTGCFAVTLTATNSNGSDAETKTCYINVTAAPTYCVPNPGTGTTEGDYINGVVLGTINNIASGSTTGPNYTNYFATMSTNVNKSAAYTISITGGSYNPDVYAAWIDYNSDGDFLDAGEKLGEFTATAPFQTQTLNFTVPAGATTGTTRMRVRCAYGATSMNPCTDYTYGETEDYKVVIYGAGNPPVANLSANTTNFCGSTCINFTDMSTNSPTSWSWSFQGASPAGSTSQNPTNICYNQPGTYSVTLTATNAAGFNTITKTSYITMTALPVANAGNDKTICQGSSTTLSGSGGSSYAWLPTTGLSAANIASPVASPTSTITYTLTVTEGSCTSVDQVTVNVTPSFTVNAGYDSTICSGGSSILNASGGGSYSWSPSTGLSATNIYNPVASPTVTTPYTVTVSVGNCTATDIVTITVNNVPAQPGTISGSTVACANGNESYNIAAVTGAASYTWTLPGAWTGTSATNSITTAIGTTGGSIMVVANNSCGSSTAQTLSVAVTTAAPLQPALISGDDTVCAGSSQLYSVVNIPNIASYSWTLPGGWVGTSLTNSITATAGTSGGAVSVIANNSCGSSPAQTLTVVVDPLPAVTLVLSPNMVCLNTGTFMITGGSPAGGVYSGTGVSAGNFNPSAAGIGTFPVTYVYTDANGCANTATESFIVDLCSDFTNIAADDRIIIYPNPFSDNVTLSWNFSENHIVELFDILGKNIRTWNVLNDELIIDSSDLEDGIYYIRSRSASGSSVNKVIKLK